MFTPQAGGGDRRDDAAATQRGRAITFIFLGWSVASVLGMPMLGLLGETFGWRVRASSASPAVGARRARGCWRRCPTACGRRRCRARRGATVFTNPVLMAMVLVTALAGAGQFTLFSYFAPYFRQVLGASTRRRSRCCSSVFGVFGLIGNVLASRHVDRFGAGARGGLLLALMALSLLAVAAGDGSVVAAGAGHRAVGARLLRGASRRSRRG